MVVLPLPRFERLAPGPRIRTQPAQLRRVAICTASGDLPNPECPVRHDVWFIAGKSPAKVSTLHRRVLQDNRTGAVVCEVGPNVRSEIFEYWPTDLQRLFQLAGMPLRQPPPNPCGLATGTAPHIVSPLRGTTHIIRLRRPSPLLLRAEAQDAAQPLRWFVDAALIGEARPGESLSWLPPTAGRFQVRVMDTAGQTDSREVVVELAE